MLCQQLPKGAEETHSAEIETRTSRVKNQKLSNLLGI
jgi:hypothetical protein